MMKIRETYKKAGLASLVIGAALTLNSCAPDLYTGQNNKQNPNKGLNYTSEDCQTNVYGTKFKRRKNIPLPPR